MIATLAVATLFGLAPLASAAGDDAEIAVTFSDDDKGFNVTSSKDISNVIVEFCVTAFHKHEDIDSRWFNHTETEVVVAVWVKSGNNHDGGPPGSGERFENAGVECDDEEEPCVDDVTTVADECDEGGGGCVDDPATLVDECDEDEGCVDDVATVEDECGETEIPFFPGFTSVVLGSLGAMAAVGIVLRRRS